MNYLYIILQLSTTFDYRLFLTNLARSLQIFTEWFVIFLSVNFQ